MSANRTITLDVIFVNVRVIAARGSRLAAGVRGPGFGIRGFRFQVRGSRVLVARLDHEDPKIAQATKKTSNC
jgi:hypothetical protein